MSEDRHAACRHGVLTHGYRATWVRTDPVLLHLCLWKPDKAPPALSRAWGGLIELDDCANCPVFDDMGASEESP